MTAPDFDGFQADLADLINRYGLDAACAMPDKLMAEIVGVQISAIWHAVQNALTVPRTPIELESQP